MLTIGQFMQSNIAIDNAHIVPQRPLDHRPGLGGPNYPTPSDSL